MTSEGRPALTRRRLLGTAGASGVAGVAGCLTAEPEPSEGDARTLEVLHPWTGGDAASAMTALVDGFEATRPDVETNFEPAAVDGNLEFEDVVGWRLSDGNPPSSFPAWPGGNLETFGGYLGDADVWDDADFADAHADEVEALCRHDGTYAAVPVGAHRVNCLFYNVGVVEDAGVDPDSLSNVPDLLDALERVAENTDATPLAHAATDAWTTLQLFETVLLGQEGRDAYATFVDGDGAESAVRGALETTRAILSNYVAGDAPSINHVRSRRRIANGEAAFLQQSAWAAGGFRADGLAFGEEWDLVPFPGTEGTYAMHIDSFLYPVDDSGENPSPAATEAWLRYVGGAAGQEEFNARRSSTPTRTDASTESFGSFLAETYDDFRNADERPASIAHGLAVGPDQLSKLESAVEDSFSGDYDVETTARQFLEAVGQ